MIGVQAAGSVFSAMGARKAAAGQRGALRAQAALDDINAKISLMNAESELIAGQRDEQKVRLNTAQVKGAQKASFAASGIALDGDPTSTVNNILTTTDTMGEIDANTVAANAIRNAWGYRIESVNNTNRALLARAAAKSINPDMVMATSLIGSASSLAKNYYSLDKAGAFG
jgi:hypothetical protein